ncbi:MAG TPA: DUF3108 domain-containing protein [Vineibacter sp.]|nr:DUF3108 domain-containing protein [Vineibacter sp.]
MHMFPGRLPVWTAACALVLLGSGSPVTAQTPSATGRVVTLEYEFTVSGLRAFRAEAHMRVDGDRYVVDAKFSKEGIAAALSATFNGSNRAWGTAGPQGLRPQGGWSWIQFRNNTRTWQVAYRGDGTYSEEHKPPFAPKDYKTVSADQKRGALDPMTAAISGALGGHDPCDRVYPVFDSKRRFDVTLRRVGSGKLKNGEVTGAVGEATVCEAVMKRIAGYEEERMKQDAYEKNPPKLWFSALDGFERLLPVRMEMSTSFGTVLGRLKAYSVRPMTPQDRIAMDK